VALGQAIHEPAIDGIDVGGSTRVLFSQWDITSGLLNTNTWGIVGYSPASAQALAGNMIRWVLEQPVPQ
jgi:hypothetical protein